MFKRLLLMFTLYLTLRAQCTDNCLRCVENVCYYCDLSQGYRLIEGQCKLFQLENCYLFDDLGTCLICNQDYQIDSATQRCIKILQENLIDNCSVYDSATTCLYCKAGFYLNNGKCEQSQLPIANCDVQNSQQICLQCASSFLQSIDQKSCLPDPQLENCQSYNQIKCDSCKKGFLQVPNFYLSQVYSLVTNFQKSSFVLRQNLIQKNYIDLRGYNNCLPTSISNCDTYYTFDFCDQCAAGYLRDPKGLCVKQPFD